MTQPPITSKEIMNSYPFRNIPIGNAATIPNAPKIIPTMELIFKKRALRDKNPKESNE